MSRNRHFSLYLRGFYALLSLRKTDGNFLKSGNTTGPGKCPIVVQTGHRFGQNRPNFRRFSKMRKWANAVAFSICEGILRFMKIASFVARSILAVSLLFCAVPSVHAQDAPKKILFFSKSTGYEHDMIKRVNGEPSKAEKILAELGRKNNIEFTFTKDGSVFTPDNIAKYDAFFFYTTGDLTQLGSDKNPPMSPEGYAAFLQAISNGKGFIGTHSAADTFHSPGGVRDHAPARYKDDGDNRSPYVKMLGGEFIIHGSQQAARQIVVDKNFPGMSGVPDDFGPVEEWYSLKNFAPNLHVLLVQDTSGMKGSPYQRPNYPSTWARMYGQGRVFYTSMGHRDDIWNSPVFQSVLTGAMNWATGRVNADVTPNLQTAAPGASTLPPG
jgi:type 1 glutamine amidotransferase